jgi:hypothetical protein
MVARHIGIGALALMLARKVGAANAAERLLQKFMGTWCAEPSPLQNQRLLKTRQRTSGASDVRLQKIGSSSHLIT